MDSLKRLNKKILLLVLVLASENSFAETLTLENVISLAKVAHPAVRAAKWDAEITRQMKKSGAWLDDPEARISFEEMGNGDFRPGNADMTNYSISQKIPFPTKLVTKSRALDDEYKAKKNLMMSMERDVEFEVKEAYYKLVMSQNLLEEKSTIVKNYNQIASSLSKEYEIGGGSKDNSTMTTSVRASDIFMIKMKKAEVETEIHDLYHQQSALRAKINLMMGRDPQGKIESVPPKVKYLKVDLESLKQKLVSQNTDLKAMEFMIQKSKSHVSLAKQNYIPDLHPELTYNQRQSRDNAYSLSFNFNVPLWLNRNSAEVNQAKAQEYRAKAEYNAQKLKSDADLNYLYYHAQWHSQALNKFQGEILPLARSAVNTGLSDYKLGLSGTTDVLQKIINYQEAAVEYWNMWGDYMTEYALLKKLTGEDL